MPHSFEYPKSKGYSESKNLWLGLEKGNKLLTPSLTPLQAKSS